MFPSPDVCAEMTDGEYSGDIFIYPTSRLLTCVARSMRQQPGRWALVLSDDISEPQELKKQLDRFNMIRFAGFIPDTVEGIVIADATVSDKAVKYCISHGIRVLAYIGASDIPYHVDIPWRAVELWFGGDDNGGSLQSAIRKIPTCEDYLRLGMSNDTIPYDAATRADIIARCIINRTVDIFKYLPPEWSRGASIFETIDTLTAGGYNRGYSYATEPSYDETQSCETHNSDAHISAETTETPLCSNERTWSRGVSLTAYNTDLIGTILYGCDQKRWQWIWDSEIPRIISLLQLWTAMSDIDSNLFHYIYNINAMFTVYTDDIYNAETNQLIDLEDFAISPKTYEALESGVDIEDIAPMRDADDRAQRYAITAKLAYEQKLLARPYNAD